MSVGSKVTRVRGVFVGVSVGVDCDIVPLPRGGCPHRAGGHGGPGVESGVVPMQLHVSVGMVDTGPSHAAVGSVRNGVGIYHRS